MFNNDGANNNTCVKDGALTSYRHMEQGRVY